MAETSKINDDLRKLMKEGLFERLPPTFSTYFFDRLKDWDNLFPAEQNYFKHLFSLLDRSNPKAVEELFAPLRAVEEKMGVNEKSWSRREFTLEHVDFLQRSPQLAEWRATIADIFAKIDPLLDEEVARTGHSRLILVVAPAELPMGADRMWTRLKERGRLVRLKLNEEDPLTDYLPLLLTGKPRAEKAPALFDLHGQKTGPGAYDNWIVEAGDSVSALASPTSGWVGFGFDRLGHVREVLMDLVNKMVTREQIPGPRQLGERLRQMNPEELRIAAGGDPILTGFLRSVLL